MLRVETKMIGPSNLFIAKSVKGRARRSDSYANNSGEYNAQNEIANYDIDRSFMKDAYESNDWIRSIVDRTAERAAQVEIFPMPINRKLDGKGKIPDYVKRKMEKVSNILLKPNPDNESISDISGKIVRDVMVYDEAGVQIVKDGLGSHLYSNVSGEELFVNANKDGTLPEDRTYLQIRNQKIIGKWNKYEFMNFIRNRRAGYANGFSPISSIAISILGDLEMMNYNYKFFQNNARPNIAFIFENLGFGKSKGALERAEAWYNRKHKGKPHLPLFMGAEKGNVKLLEMKTTHKDMQFSEWALWLLSRIMAVYGMQPMVLGVLTDTTGKLNSEVQSEQYKRNAIIPLVKMILNTMNANLIWGDNNLNFDDIYLTSTELDPEDEERKAKIAEVYLDKGVVTINQIRNELRMAPVPWGDEPFVPMNYAPLSVLEELQRAKIDSMDVDRSSNTGKTPEEDENGKKSNKMVSDEISYLYRNFRVPTGLEKMEPTAVRDAVVSLLKKRESNRTIYSIPSNPKTLLEVVDGFGLSCKGVMSQGI